MAVLIFGGLLIATAIAALWVNQRLGIDLDDLDLRMDDELQDLDVPAQRDGSHDA